MLKLRVVKARYGDCLILLNGYGKRRKYILIDGGPDHVYGPYLRGELLKIAESGGKLDLAVLTHVDNDHVLGMLELMDELKQEREQHKPELIQLKGMWHNAFSKILPETLHQEANVLETEMANTPLPDPSGAPADPGEFGVAEGHELQVVNEALGIPRNVGFPDGLVTMEGAVHPVKVGGMRLWIIGPPEANLNRIREKWVKWLMRKGLPFSPGEKAPVKPDDSEANLSSIMFLAEASKRRILLTGDGLGDDIVSGLEKVGLLPPEGTIHVNVFKLPHHGSERNAVGSLFERVLADTYVISADGRYGNPDWQTLVWLVDAVCRQGRDVNIFATNPTPSLERLVKERPPAENHYTLTIMPAGAISADL